MKIIFIPESGEPTSISVKNYILFAVNPNIQTYTDLPFSEALAVTERWKVESIIEKAFEEN